MTETNNSRFSVEALVAKYCNFVEVNTPKSVEYDSYERRVILDPINFEDSNADYHLIAKLYHDVFGDKANNHVIGVMSKYEKHYYASALTDEEYSFLRENFSEFLSYEFTHKVNQAGIFNLLCDSDVSFDGFNGRYCFALSKQVLETIERNVTVPEHSNVFVLGDINGAISSLFSNKVVVEPQGKLSDYWALNVIRYCMNSKHCNVAIEEPEAHTQDVVVYYNHTYVVPGEKRPSLSDAFDKLNSTGRLYLDISRDRFNPDSEIYSEVRKLLSQKVITSILSYENKVVFGLRYLVVIDKKGSDHILMKAEAAAKPVSVPYNEVDPDLLWPGHYYTKRKTNVLPLSSLVTLNDQCEKPSENTAYFLESEFLGSTLTDAILRHEDLYMGNKFVQMRIDNDNSMKEFGEEPILRTYEEHQDDYVNYMRFEANGITPFSYLCSCPSVFFSSWLNVGYLSEIPSGGVSVSTRGIYALVPRDGVTPQYIAALLLDDDIRRQILCTCENDVNQNSLKYILDKIYVPAHSPIERERYVNSVLVDSIENLKKEKERDLTNYRKGIRMRKHAVSQSLSSLSAMFNALNSFRKRNSGTFSDNDVVSRVKGFTVADAFDYIEQKMPQMMEEVDHMADIDYSFGKATEINPEKFVENYISSHNGGWMNFNATVDWSKNGNIALVDIVKDGRVIAKKGSALKSMIFPWGALDKVFSNIISNMKEYAFTDKNRSDYELHFSWYMSGDSIVLEISNNGNPISADRDVKSLLEYGVSSNLHIKGHNGIGCYEIKGIMNRFNGDFEIQSTPDEKYTVKYLLTFKSTRVLT